jgi:transcriptional regulator with GAF, ATPase, and Fis domain
VNAHACLEQLPEHDIGGSRKSAGAGRQWGRDLADDAHVAVRDAESAVRADTAIVSKSQAIRSALAQAALVAPTNTTVLLLGETGVGKEVFAKAIHAASPRHRLPMIRVNAAAIPATLIESELFGHERGAFTDALSRQIGRFEAANGSTLFLDEIGELSPEMQVKLLRVLEERTIERLGGRESIKVDIRIIAATNRNLEDAVSSEQFREDLFYRINVFPITVPPLRERSEDIPDLAWTFVDELSRRFGKKIESIDSQSLSDLQRYSWPGNVRELRNAIERAVILAKTPTLSPAVPRTRQLPLTRSLRLVDVQTEHIRSVLESCSWRIRGERGAAVQLGIKPTTLESRIAKLRIRRDSLRPE